jgi:hypothetical protein
MYEAQVYSPSISGYVHCYQSNGDDPCLYLPPIYIAPYRFTWISPSLSVASAFIKSYTKLAIEVDEWNSTLGKLQSYMGLGTHPELQPGYFGTSTAYLPYLPSGWANGIQVQNMSQNPSHIHVTVNGQLLYDNSVAGHGWVNVTTYTGSEGMVQSVDGYPLLVEVDNYRNITGDWLMSYMGVNR